MSLTKRTIIGLLLVIAVSGLVGFVVTMTFSVPIYANYVATEGLPIDYVLTIEEVWA